MVLEAIATINQAVNNFVWGIPAMVCIIGVGLLLSVRAFCRSANSRMRSKLPSGVCSAKRMPLTVQ